MYVSIENSNLEERFFTLLCMSSDMLLQRCSFRKVLLAHRALEWTMTSVRLKTVSCNAKTWYTNNAYLNMSTYLLLALEAIVPIPITLIPEALVLRFPAPNMCRIDMGGEFGAG